MVILMDKYLSHCCYEFYSATSQNSIPNSKSLAAINFKQFIIFMRRI